MMPVRSPAPRPVPARRSALCPILQLMDRRHIYVPTTGPEDWRQLLAQPNVHWRRGASAQTLAEAWEGAANRGEAWPPAVQRVIATDASLGELELLLAFPEYQVPLPGGTRPSQTDLMVIARNGAGQLVVIAVEGKVAEPFGELVSDWRHQTTPGRDERLAFLLATIGLEDDKDLDGLRYQLLHRTASAVIVAEQFGARNAVMLVHSFHPDALWLEDFTRFAGRYGATVGKDELAPVAQLDSVSLHLGWVSDTP